MTRRRLPYLLVALFALLGGRTHHSHAHGHRSQALPHAELGSTRVIEMPTTTTTEPATSTTTAVPESLEQRVIDGPTFACIRQVESGDNYTWGWDPYGTGDGGGAYQFEPGTYAQGAQWAGVSPEDHSRTAQDAVAFAIWQHVGYSPWTDGCE